ncbi:MAG: RIP metalloprotease RseP [Kiritimatiellae bacterium]|nr:RIP metalloprotease RseP [Kiritimatiellia bacterium]
MDALPIPPLLINILAGVGVAILFSLAVFVHELGHFLMARWLGLTIDAFSIGFGPAIWKRRIGGVEYRISSIPLGGYVALPQMDPAGMESIQGEHAHPEAGKADEPAPPVRVLPDVAPWKRMVVALAGPLGNLIFAVALAWVIYLTPDNGAGGADTTVGMVATNSPAYAAGLRRGDRIESVNRNRVANWNEFVIECHLGGDLSNGLSVVVARQGQPLNLTLPVERDPDGGFMTVSGVSPRLPAVVGAVMTNSPAERAGLLPRDIVESIEGVPVADPMDMTARVAAHGAHPMRLALRRGGRPLEVELTPEFNAAAGRHLVGVVFNGMGPAPQWMQYRQPLRQLTNDAKSVVRILRALVAPRTRGEVKRAAGSLSGPLVIVVLLWYQVRSGFIIALAFLRFLCVNLALLNLLPLPVLDGGHIVFAVWEIVTGRKPPPKLVNWLANIFAVLLIGLMTLLIFRDALSLHRIFKRHEPLAVETVSTNTPAVSPDGGGTSAADGPLADAAAAPAP